MTRPVELRWHLPIAASVDAAWPLVCDTDRFNRAAGLGMSFREEAGPDGTRRRGELSRFGLTIGWEELPFEFRAPERFSQRRTYDAGPVAWSAVAAELEPTPEGCTLHYTVAIAPRWSWVRPLVQLESWLVTRRQLERALRALVHAIEGDRAALDVPPRPLVGEETRLLVDGLAGVEPPALADALRARIESAPLVDQQRLRPLAFAEALGLEAEPVIRGFLEAVRRGVLELRWELICPSCLGAKSGSAQLALRPGAIHCPSCDIRYDGSFPDSVEVVFRPTRRVREVETEVACLLSPARTPHVLAQEALEPGEERSLGLDLPAGGYRINTHPTFGGASMEVRPGIPARRVTLDLTPHGVRPAVFRVQPGPVEIALRNRTGAPARVTIERRTRSRHVLTAGRLLELPDSRDLLPPEAVAPGLDVHVRQAWVVAVNQVQVGAGATGSWDVEGDAVANGTLLRTFDDPTDAIAFARPYDGDPDVSVGLASGPVAVLTDGDDSVPSGRAVDAALDVARAVGGGHVAVAERDATALPALGDTGALGPGVDGWYRIVRFVGGPARPPPPRADAPPAIDGLAIGAEIGRGAMGRVLAAEDGSGRRVVVKVLLPELARDPDHAQRFYNEAAVSRSLHHPNLVAVHDYGTTASGDTYLVMERLDGEELRDALQEGPLAPARAKEVAVGVLRGLQAAHEAGVVHRDIKPANIFLVADGGVKVIDFGIAHALDTADELARRGVVLGSPRYMAPEQIAREPLDGRADLYATGLVLYECLTGDVPFEGADALSLARARLERPPAPLHERCRQPLPPGLEPVVMRALEREPDRRYATADAMADALETVRSAD